MRGILRYKVRGLSAVQGGFLSGAIMGVATGVGMQAAAGNALKLLGGIAKLSGNAGLAEMNTFLRTGKGFDFSGAPVSAGYDVHLDFVLESDQKGNWHLKTGSANYSGNTDADLTLTGSNGNVHRFTDRFRGMGSARLTPDNASITLTYEGKGRSRRAHFDVDVKFPVTVVGKTIWSAMAGAAVITREDKGDVATASLDFLGQHYSDNESNSKWYAGVSYGRDGMEDIVFPRGRETWQDLTDSGVLVEYELFDECRAVIIDPKKKGRLVFDEKKPAKISRTALADVTPGAWGDALAWRLPRLTGSTVLPEPVDANGAELPFSYETMPGKSEAFGEKLLEASFGEAAGKGGCKNPPLHPVRFFFPRDAFNGPDPSEPNWFWYWKQTKAGQGFGPTMRYGGKTVGSCREEGVRGFCPMMGRGDHFYICDLTPDNFTKRTNMTGTFREGIDKFASTTRHEGTHLEHYLAWWKGPYGDRTAELIKKFDFDNDRVPNDVEESMGFDPRDPDSNNAGWDDEHFLTLLNEDDWENGTADKEDWACPGKQSGADKQCN